MVICSISFEIAGKRIGSFAVNVLRLIIGLTLLSITTFFIRGLPLPTDASFRVLLYLGFSGLLGMFLGDIFLFESYVLLGARVTTLLMTLIPAFTSIISFIFLKEKLSFMEIAGISLTTIGIFLTLSKRNQDNGQKKVLQGKGYNKRGFVCATFAIIAQGVGMIVTRVGLSDGYDPIAGTQIRVIAALIAFIIISTVRKKWTTIFSSTKDKKASFYVVLGSFFGPYLGVTAMSLGLKYASAGVVATLGAISPILIIPFSIGILKEKISLLEGLGAFIAVLGVVLFFV